MHCKESHMKWEEMHSDEYGVAHDDAMDSYNYEIHGTWDGTDTNAERALIKEYTSKRFSGSLT